MAASAMDHQQQLQQPAAEPPLSADQVDVLKIVYSGPFNVDVRCALDDWIKAKLIPLIQTSGQDSAGSQPTAADVTKELIEALDAKIRDMPNDDSTTNTKFRLQQSAQTLTELAKQCPGQLFMDVRQCVEQEINIALQGAAACQMRAEDNVYSRLMDQLNDLQSRTEIISSSVEEYRVDQEDLSAVFRTCQQKMAAFETVQRNKDEETVLQLKLELEGLKGSLAHKFKGLTKNQSDIYTTLANLCQSVEQTEEVVIDQELNNWKKEQMKVGNGHPLDVNRLEGLQNLCQILATILIDTRQHINSLLTLKSKITTKGPAERTPPIDLQSLLSQVTEMLRKLVIASFIIDKQPPQVIKTNARIDASLRFLTGNALKFKQAPRVNVTVVNEAQADALHFPTSGDTWDLAKNKCGEILHDSETAEYNNITNQLTCWFKKMHLKKIIRPEKKPDKKCAEGSGETTVLDEKYALLFRTEFIVADLQFKLWTLSLPVAITVHGNQEEQALSTILWDHGFAKWGRRCFSVAEKVKWGEMAKVLNMKWKDACGQGLTEQNLHYLACRAFRNNNLPKDPEVYNNMDLSRSLFSKEDMPIKAGKKPFTFWEWFHQALVLICKHLKSLWAEGFVLGFIKKEEGEAILRDRANGTFLLRFSDSSLGSITIAYVLQTPSGEIIVNSLAPWTMSELMQKSLVERVLEIQQLKRLYPEIPKVTLQKFTNTPTTAAAPPTKTDDGYVACNLVTTIANLNLGESNPNEATRPRKRPRPNFSPFQQNVNDGVPVEEITTPIDLGIRIDFTPVLGQPGNWVAVSPPQDGRASYNSNLSQLGSVGGNIAFSTSPAPCASQIQPSPPVRNEQAPFPAQYSPEDIDLLATGVMEEISSLQMELTGTDLAAVASSPNGGDGDIFANTDTILAQPVTQAFDLGENVLPAVTTDSQGLFSVSVPMATATENQIIDLDGLNFTVLASPPTGPGDNL